MFLAVMGRADDVDYWDGTAAGPGAAERQTLLLLSWLLPSNVEGTVMLLLPPSYILSIMLEDSIPGSRLSLAVILQPVLQKTVLHIVEGSELLCQTSSFQQVHASVAHQAAAWRRRLPPAHPAFPGGARPRVHGTTLALALLPTLLLPRHCPSGP